MDFFLGGTALILLGVCFVVGVGILVYVKKIHRCSSTKLLDDKVNQLFYNQHESLFLHKDVFVDTEKVEEVVFYNKQDLFSQSIGETRLQNYLLLGTHDLEYIQGLVAQQPNVTTPDKK